MVYYLKQKCSEAVEDGSKTHKTFTQKAVRYLFLLI